MSDEEKHYDKLVTMSDDEMVSGLRQLVDPLAMRAWFDRARLIGSVIARIRSRNVETPPEGSREVRIACVFSKNYWASRWIDGISDSEAIGCARDEIQSEDITHEAIVVVNIPACKVPVIPGTVEEPSCSTDSANS